MPKSQSIKWIVIYGLDCSRSIGWSNYELELAAADSSPNFIVLPGKPLKIPEHFFETENFSPRNPGAESAYYATELAFDSRS